MTSSFSAACPVCAECVSTLHHGVRGFHRGQVGDDSDIIIPAGALDVDVDGAFNLAVQACHHARGVCHIGQATLAVVPGRWEIAVRVIGKWRILAKRRCCARTQNTHTHEHCQRGTGHPPVIGCSYKS